MRVGYHGGLPGDGWDNGDQARSRWRAEGRRGRVAWATTAVAKIKDGVGDHHDKDGKELGKLDKVHRIEHRRSAPSRRQARSCCSTANRPTPSRAAK